MRICSVSPQLTCLILGDICRPSDPSPLERWSLRTPSPLLLIDGMFIEQNVRESLGVLHSGIQCIRGMVSCSMRRKDPHREVRLYLPVYCYSRSALSFLSLLQRCLCAWHGRVSFMESRDKFCCIIHICCVAPLCGVRASVTFPLHLRETNYIRKLSIWRPSVTWSFPFLTLVCESYAMIITTNSTLRQRETIIYLKQKIIACQSVNRCRKKKCKKKAISEAYS